MPGLSRLRCRKPVLGLALVAVVLLPPAAAAQDRVKIEIVTRIAHTSYVSAAALSRDGALVLTAGNDDRTVKLWHAATGRLIRTFAADSSTVNAVAFAPDGTRVASAGKQVTLRDVATGRILRTLDHGRSVESLAFSPDGTRLVSGDGWLTGGGVAKLWDVATGRLVHSLVHAPHGPTRVLFSPDGSHILTSGVGERQAKLWDTATGHLLQAFGEGREGDVPIVAGAFSPDGARVLTGHARFFQMWDAATGQLIRAIDVHPHVLSFVAFSKDGARILAGVKTAFSSASWDENKGGPGLNIWEAETGALVETLAGAMPFAMSADGSRFLERNGPMWRVRNVAAGEAVHHFYGQAPVVSIAVSPDGERVLSGIFLGDAARLWETATGRQVSAASLKNGRVLSGPYRKTTLPYGVDRVVKVAFVPDGARILSERVEKLDLWDAATGLHIRSFPRDTRGRGGGIALSPDGAQLATITDSTVILWDTATGRVARTFAGSRREFPSPLAFSADSARIASASDVWEAATGRVVRTFVGASRYSRGEVAFSPDGGRVLSAEQPVKLWDVATGGAIRTFDHPAEVASVAFSPDGAQVLLGYAGGDASLLLWETATGRLVHAFQGHTGDVTSAAFSHDGRRIFSGGADGTVRLWDHETGALLATLVAASRGEWLVVTPEGLFDTSSKATATELLSIVRGVEAFSVEQFYAVLHRPDLVRSKLAGDPDGKVKAAAAELEEKLKLH